MHAVIRLIACWVSMVPSFVSGVSPLIQYSTCDGPCPGEWEPAGCRQKLAIIRRGRGSSLQTADMNLAELLGQYGVSYATLKLLASEPLTGLHSRRYVQVSYESKLLERRQP